MRHVSRPGALSTGSRRHGCFYHLSLQVSLKPQSYISPPPQCMVGAPTWGPALASVDKRRFNLCTRWVRSSRAMATSNLLWNMITMKVMQGRGWHEGLGSPSSRTRTSWFLSSRPLPQDHMFKRDCDALMEGLRKTDKAQIGAECCPDDTVSAFALAHRSLWSGEVACTSQ